MFHVNNLLIYLIQDNPRCCFSEEKTEILKKANEMADQNGYLDSGAAYELFGSQLGQSFLSFLSTNPEHLRICTLGNAARIIVEVKVIPPKMPAEKFVIHDG